MSAMRPTNNQVNCKSSVKSASVQQSVQRQVIGQINVKSTSENHSRPKNRKSGKRLTPIASDRPAPPVLRRWRGGGRATADATEATGTAPTTRPQIRSPSVIHNTTQQTWFQHPTHAAPLNGAGKAFVYTGIESTDANRRGWFQRFHSRLTHTLFGQPLESMRKANHAHEFGGNIDNNWRPHNAKAHCQYRNRFSVFTAFIISFSPDNLLP